MNIATSPPLWILSVIAATFGFWTCFGACVDAPLPPNPPQARVIATWDPLRCGEPHRVAVELEDDGGGKLAASTPCSLGSLTMDVRQFGVYLGRIYAWNLGTGARSVAPVQLFVDEPIVEWQVETPR
jgi:hypothetical protein